MPYREVRKIYIQSRADVLLRETSGTRNRGHVKELACREFDNFVQNERDIAVAEALLALIHEGEGTE
jgi:hypothetical protein